MSRRRGQRPYRAAPPIKRANPDGVPVRLHDGALVAHADQELADRLMAAGAAEALRSGPRRYLRLQQDISVPRTGRGWDIVEYLRRWLGDQQTAAYIAHKDRQSERLRYQPPIQAPARVAADPMWPSRHPKKEKS